MELDLSGLINTPAPSSKRRRGTPAPSSAPASAPSSAPAPRRRRASAQPAPTPAPAPTTGQSADPLSQYRTLDNESLEFFQKLLKGEAAPPEPQSQYEWLWNELGESNQIPLIGQTKQRMERGYLKDKTTGAITYTAWHPVGSKAAIRDEAQSMLASLNKVPERAPTPEVTLQTLKIGDATVVKKDEFEKAMAGYSALSSEKMALYQKLDGFDKLKSVGSFKGNNFYKTEDINALLGSYQAVKPEALGDDPISQALRKNAVQFGDGLIIKSDVGGYYQKLAAEVNDSRIGYYGLKSVADAPKDIKFTSTHESAPVATLMVDGKVMNYVPYEAAARVWGDSQGGLSGISQLIGNENLLNKSVVNLPDEIKKQLAFKDGFGTQYKFDDPGLGYLLDANPYVVNEANQVGISPLRSYDGFDNWDASNKYANKDTYKGAWLERMTPEMRQHFNSLPGSASQTANNNAEWIARGAADYSGSSRNAAWLTIDTDSKKDGFAHSNYWWYKEGDGGFFGKLNNLISVVAPVLSFFPPTAAIGAAMTLGQGIGSGDIGKIFSGAVGLNVGGIGDFTKGLGSSLGSALNIGDTAGKMLASGLTAGTLSELSGGDFLKSALTGAAITGGAEWAGDFLTDLKGALPESFKNVLGGAYTGSTNPFELNYENSFDNGAMFDAVPTSFWDSLINNAKYTFTTEDGLKNLVKRVGIDAAKQHLLSGKIDVKSLGINAVSNVFGTAVANSARAANLFGDSSLGNAGEAAIGGAVSGAVGSGLSGGDIGTGALNGAVMSGGTKLVSDWLNSNEWLQKNGYSNATVKDGVLGAFKGGTWAALNDRDISDGLLAGAAGGLLSGYLKDSKLVTDIDLANAVGSAASGLIKKSLTDVPDTPTPTPRPTPTPTTPPGNTPAAKNWKFNNIGFSSVLPQFQHNRRTTNWGNNRLGANYG